MKRIILAALLAGIAAMGLSKTTAHGTSSTGDARPTVYVVNHSHVPAWKLNQDVGVFQKVVDEDLGPIWSVSARLVVANPLPKPLPPNSMVIYLKDGINVWGAAGFHAVSATTHTPYAQVDVSLKGIQWSEIFTHELEEMLVDPYIDRMSGVMRCKKSYWSVDCTTKTFFYVEVSDAVEASRYDYIRLSPVGKPVYISDFVTPAWYTTSTKGPFDFAGRLWRNHQVLPGGYIYYCKSGKWDSVDKFHPYRAARSSRN